MDIRTYKVVSHIIIILSWILSFEHLSIFGFTNVDKDVEYVTEYSDVTTVSSKNMFLIH